MRKQVVGIRGLVVDVAKKEGGPCAIYRGLVSDQRTDRMVRGNDCDDDDQGCHWDDPSCASSVEVAKRGVSRRVTLAEQQSRDDESRYDKEDLNTDVTAAEGGYARVVDEGQEDGDGTQSLHVGTKAAIARWSPCFILGDQGLIDGDRHRLSTRRSTRRGLRVPPRRPTTART